MNHSKMQTPRKRVPCAECGQFCRTVSGLCHACRWAHISPDVLENGAWVPRGGVMVWQEAS